MKIDPSKPLYLTSEEARKIIMKKSSYGTDGKVFQLNSNYLIKLYHSKISKLLSKDRDNVMGYGDDSDIKIYEHNKINKIEVKPIDELMHYYSFEENGEKPVRIRSQQAIELARERQMLVKRTHLPKNAVYIDGSFAGCILLAEHGLQIHKLTGMPLNYKKKILKKVLENVSELFDNCIYQVELYNKPHSKKAILKHEDGTQEEVGHSHVLINPITLTPKIIDLDGKSTRYTSSPSLMYENMSMEGICILMIEFLLGVDLDEYGDSFEDLAGLADLLEYIGVKAEYIDRLSRCELDFEEANDFVDSLENIKRL